MDVRIRVLGSLEVERDRTLVTPSANKLRQALGLLALNNGHAVETQHLIGELWGDNPPASARSTLQTYVHKVRRLLFPRQATQAERLLQTGNDGYALVLPTPDLDLSLFERHCERAQATYNAGDFEQAIEHISRGLALWRGQAFSGIAQCRSIDRARTALEESRMAVIELRIDA